MSPELEKLTTELDACKSGFRAGFSLPPLMVFVAMIGFGSLAKSQGIGLIGTLLATAGIYGLPGQIAMVELYATSASLIAIITAVSMANMRFLPMTLSLLPEFSRTGSLFRWRYLLVQFISVNSWSYFLPISRKIPINLRLGFFTGFGAMCFSGGLLGAAVGWQLAGVMPWQITATLVFLNPAYFVFLFCSNSQRSIILSLIGGAILGPMLFKLSPEWSLPLSGLIAGSIGYFLSRVAFKPDVQASTKDD